MKILSEFNTKYNVSKGSSDNQVRVDGDVRDTISKIVSSLGYNDFEFTSEEISRINALKDCAVNLNDSSSITNYGISTTEKISVALGDMQGIVHSDNLHSLQNSLNELLLAMESITKYITSNWFNKLFMKKLEHKLVDNLSKYIATKLVELNQELEKCPDKFDELDSLFRKLSVYIISGYAFLSACDLKNNSSNDIFKSQKIKDMNESIERFKRKLSSMVTLRHSLLLQMAQIRLEKRNLESLIDSAYETIVVGIPVWKQYIGSYQLNKTSEDLIKINELQSKMTISTGCR